MRTISLVIFLLFSVITQAKSGAWTVSTYEIISNKYSESVPNGYFRLSGLVFGDSISNPLTGIEIADQSYENKTETNSQGLFEMNFPLKDSVIFVLNGLYEGIQIKGPFKNRYHIKVKVKLMPAVFYNFKPVIYAYNANETANLKLKPKGDFTFTYPISETGEWTIKTSSDGSLIDEKTGKRYPYIFWEALQAGLTPKVKNNEFEGYLVKTDTCISFFENVLSAHGLNSREATDFITFWGPRMIVKPYALVQFLSTEQYGQAIAELAVDPKPESLLRLYMIIIPLDDANHTYQIKKPAIKSFERTGFTVVEWGGSVLEMNKTSTL